MQEDLGGISGLSRFKIVQLPKFDYKLFKLMPHCTLAILECVSTWIKDGSSARLTKDGNYYGKLDSMLSGPCTDMNNHLVIYSIIFSGSV